MTQAADTNERQVGTTSIALPPPTVSVDQDREWCVVEVDGRWRRIRFHDYDEIYAVPRLYETLFYDVLNCVSPAKIRRMLCHCIREARLAPGDFQALDLGAGNGMVGEELVRLGMRRVVGIDISRAAAEAAHRDRREVYDDYLVVDMTAPSEEDLSRLSEFDFNCMTCVAALGFGDIPPEAFANAYNLIAAGGWVAFNIKSDFLDPEDRGGFASLIRRMVDDDLMSVCSRERYQHRLATSGEPLLYTAFVTVKNRDVPGGWKL